jgi:cytochrome c oxidase subunit 2
MSLLNNAVAPIAVVALCGLAFVLGIGHYSQEQTAAHLRQVGQRRAEAEVIRRSEETTRLQVFNARVNAARAQQAQLAAAMEKAAQAAALVALPGDPAKGEMTYMPCATCHGMQAEGKRVFNAPRLAGQEPWYVRSQLLKFKEGVRVKHPHDIYGMQMAMATSLIYNEEVLDNVVAYIASLTTGKTVERGKVDVAAGQQHYAVCAACHGVNAQGIETQQALALNNQHAWYLKTQLKHFKYGLRGTHKSDIEGRQMVPVMQVLKDEVLDDLVAYIQSRNVL